MWDILNDRRTAERGFINVKIAKDGFKNYLAGNANNSFYLWQWLNLELWAREFLDR